jgi:hypothetical protein
MHARKEINKIMEPRRFHSKILLLSALLIATAALYLIPMHATAAGSTAQQNHYNKAVLHVTISLTSKGMVVTPATLYPGNHFVTIKNTTSDSRGVEMIGIDSESSPTVRYTKILKPGKTEQFRWFFAQGNTMYVRDIMSCGHDQKSCLMVTFGQMRKAIWVR